jgi:hypothetical protein
MDTLDENLHDANRLGSVSFFKLKRFGHHISSLLSEIVFWALSATAVMAMRESGIG